MEFFPDRAHVRLKSCVRGRFLYVGEDGWRVSLSARRESPNTAWVVHRVVRGGTNYILLHNAAWYLAFTDVPAPNGHVGRRTVLNNCNAPQQNDVAWEAIHVGDHIVVTLNVSNCLLRANGRYCRWHNGVSVDDVHNLTTMMH